MINELQYALHARSREYQRVLNKSIALLETELDNTCYVSFSAGKDSAVVAHLCNALHPGIPILMVDVGVPTMWEETEREMWLAYIKKEGWNFKSFEWDKWGKTSYSENTLGVLHKDMFHDLDKYASENKLSSRIMGIRADESKQRASSVKGKGQVYEYKAGGRRILPIAWWSTNDIWAYIISNKIPHLKIYDRIGADARSGLIGVNGWNRGRIVYLKKYFPRAYENAKTLIPEVENYV